MQTCSEIFLHSNEISKISLEPQLKKVLNQNFTTGSHVSLSEAYFVFCILYFVFFFSGLSSLHLTSRTMFVVVLFEAYSLHRSQICKEAKF